MKYKVWLDIEKLDGSESQTNLEPFLSLGVFEDYEKACDFCREAEKRCAKGGLSEYTVVMHDTSTPDPDSAILFAWVSAENAVEAFKKARERLRGNEYSWCEDDEEWRDHKGAILPIAVYPGALWDQFPHGTQEAMTAIGGE